MEKVWCGSRGKAMKGACTIFVQDGHSNYPKNPIFKWIIVHVFL
jgi:hypothetical protein